MKLVLENGGPKGSYIIGEKFQSIPVDLSGLFPNWEQLPEGGKHAARWVVDLCLRNTTAGKLTDPADHEEAFQDCQKRAEALNAGKWAVARTGGTRGISKSDLLVLAMAEAFGLSVDAAVETLDGAIEAAIDAANIDDSESPEGKKAEQKIRTATRKGIQSTIQPIYLRLELEAKQKQLAAATAVDPAAIAAMKASLGR